MHPSDSGAATQTELNKFVKVVDEFKAKYARLISPATRNDVYATKNATLISDYESAVSRGGALNSSINALVGAWNVFKRGYASVTDVTSTAIGDAVDEIRSWFGYKPMGDLQIGLGALGLVQIPAAIGVAGIIGAALVLIAAMNRIFIATEASRIQRENPGTSRAVALRQAEAGLPSFIPGGLTPLMIAAGAVALNRRAHLPAGRETYPNDARILDSDAAAALPRGLRALGPPAQDLQNETRSHPLPARRRDPQEVRPDLQTPDFRLHGLRRTAACVPWPAGAQGLAARRRSPCAPGIHGVVYGPAHWAGKCVSRPQLHHLAAIRLRRVYKRGHETCQRRGGPARRAVWRRMKCHAAITTW